MTYAIWHTRIPALTLLVILIVQPGCTPSEPVFHASDNPARLSDWKLFALSSHSLIPASSTLVFTPANQLFSDYAQKLRTMWLPPDTAAQWQDGEIDYPVGTILSKTFYYPIDAAGVALPLAPFTQHSIDLQSNTLVETRLLVRREQGWRAFPYVWNDEQTEAFLRVAGSSTEMELKRDTGNLLFSYFVPDENQCAGCHVTEHPDGGLQPLAATAKQLASAIATDESATPIHAERDNKLQLEALQARGWLTADSSIDSTTDNKGNNPMTTAATSWLNTSASIADRASAYLEVHCGHCHNPAGAADTSALLLDGSITAPVNLGVCKSPVAAGGGAGDRLFAIVPGAPERSILLYRMESMEPDEMMPELGRSLVHSEGVALIRQWIAQMPGTCDSAIN